MKWFEDSVDKKFRDRVLRAGEVELNQLRPATARRFFFAQATGMLSAALVALIVWRFYRSETESAPPSLVEGDQDPKMLDDLAILEDLELWQDLKVLENAKELDEEA